MPAIESDDRIVPCEGAPMTPAMGVSISPHDVYRHSSWGGRDVPGGNSPPPPPPDSPRKTFLGETLEKWGGWVLKGTIVAAASGFAWYTYVNDAISSRPTYEEAAKISSGHVDMHTKHGDHGETTKLLKAHSEQLNELREIQIRQTIILENQTQDIKEVREDLRRRNRRGR